MKKALPVPARYPYQPYRVNFTVGISRPHRDVTVPAPRGAALDITYLISTVPRVVLIEGNDIPGLALYTKLCFGGPRTSIIVHTSR